MSGVESNSDYGVTEDQEKIMESRGSSKNHSDIDDNQELTDIIFSWSFDDVFNQNLYKNQVQKIPESFQSVHHYFRSFNFPLLEETRAELSSSLDAIPGKPYAEVISFDLLKRNSKSLYRVCVDYWRNRSSSPGKEPYRMLPGDIFVFTDAKPESASDLHRFSRAWTLASLTETPKDKNMEGSVASSFIVKTSQETELENLMRRQLYVVFLMNITRSESMWHALRMYGNLQIVKEVICTDFVIDESCSICSARSHEGFETGLASTLNESQANAVIGSLSKLQCEHKSFVQLIGGPPGTGKTRTLSVLVFMLSRMNCRTLICASTDIAIAEVAVRVLELMKQSHAGTSRKSSLCSLGDIVLFGSKDLLSTRPDVEEISLDSRVERLMECLGPLTGWKQHSTSMINFLEDCVSHYYILKYNNKNDGIKGNGKSFLDFMRESFTNIALPLRRCISAICTHLARSSLEQNFEAFVSLDNLLDSFETLLSQSKRSVSKKLLSLFSQHEVVDRPLSSVDESMLLFMKRCECLSSLKTLYSCFEKFELPSVACGGLVEEFCLQKSSLVFCTVSGAHKLHSVAMKPLNFLVIEEAANLNECELLIPLQLPDVRHAVLFGDDCQLPVVVNSDVSAKAGFGRSLFERLSLIGHSKHVLKMQYRMHPLISCFPNSNFYANQILDAPNVRHQSYEKNYLSGPLFGPYSFINISCGRVLQSSPKNMAEVAIVMKILQKLYRAWNGSNEQLSVGVTSPYNAQVVAIQEKLGQKYKSNDGFAVKVKSIEGLQGGEEDIIILSTVRTSTDESSDFIDNYQRTSIALTRARHCLWILGHGKTLLNSHSVWKAIVDDAKNRQCFYNADEDEDLAKLLVEIKTELDQFDHLLAADSVQFKDARWKLFFSSDFRKSFGKLKSLQAKKLVIYLLMRLSGGLWPKRKLDIICENSSQILKQFKVGDLYVICSIDVVKESWYIQVLKVWDLLPLEDVNKLIKRLDGIFGTYTDEYLNRCKVKCFEGDLEVPMTWSSTSDVAQFRNHYGTASSSDNGLSGKGFAENSHVKDSLLLMKFYALSSGVVSHLLSNCDGKELDFPFQLTDQEMEIVRFDGSSFILGRSGTGKTTVLIMKMFQREQLFHVSVEGFHEPKSSISTGSSLRKEYSEIDEVDKDPVLHQIFVTVNSRLSHAVKEHISRLKRSACGQPSYEESNSVDVDETDYTKQFLDIPDSFVNLQATSYPLVITLHKFLMMLDGTVGSSFFERFAEARSSDGRNASTKSVALKNFIRTKEVTYDRFNSSYLPHFSEELTRKLEPSMVFTEIMSRIKGQFNAGEPRDSLLGREDYILLSEGRLSTLTAQERERIYDIFLQYEKRKRCSGEFDMADLVIDVHRRLRKLRYEGDNMDFVYIDEVQDLNMSQIALFKYICRNFEEGFVFAGDTAQTIAKGVDFRFQDIRSVFYREFLQQSMTEKCGKKEKHQIADSFHLSQNFRTHTGILNVAQSVFDLLYHFFPTSVDALCPERSNISGETPVLLQADNENAFFNMFKTGWSLGGNIIGFGAEQVILVRDDRDRSEIFENLGKQALVLTILECKGLEFQDVLLYNFFSSSPLKNQWRVIYEWMKEKNLLVSTSKIPCFNEAKHGILCAELKQLYVAITRTRQRLWIFENDLDPAKPMFDYWKNLCIVEVQQLDVELAQKMQVSSSQLDWKSQGINLFRQNNYKMARLCFEKTEETYWKKLAEAAELQSDADHMRSSNSKMADIYLRKAAKIYDSINKPDSAAQCFFELKEYEKAGTIYLEKFLEPKWEEAGECFSLAGCYERAADVYAKGNFFSKCLSVCADKRLFDLGLQYIQFWNTNATFDENILTKRSEMERIAREFLRSAAVYYHKLKDCGSMMKFVRAFVSKNDMRTFLEKKNCLDELLLLEEEWGNFLGAANVARLKGHIQKEADLLEKAGHFKEAAMLVLQDVLCNSLWAPGSEGWPLKDFRQKNELLSKAKTLSKNISDHFHNLICTETKVFSENRDDLFKMRQYLRDLSRLGSVRGEILCARKILDAHFDTSVLDYELKEESVSDFRSDAEDRVSQNNVSVGKLVYFWNFWKYKIEKVFEYLENLEGQDVHGEFCLSYLGVRTHTVSTKRMFQLLNPKATWVREIDYHCIEKKGSMFIVGDDQFSVAAKSFWSSETLSVGAKLLHHLKAFYDYSVDNKLSVHCQSMLLIHIFEASKFLVKSRYMNQRYHNSLPQKFLETSAENLFACIYPMDCRKSLDDNMIFLRGRKRSKNLIEDIIYKLIHSKSELTYKEIGKVLTAILGTGKLSDRWYEQVFERFSIDLPWTACIDHIIRNRGSYVVKGSKLSVGSAPQNMIETPGAEFMILRFREVLGDIFIAGRVKENDCISPDCFLYMIERLLILIFCSKGYLYTTTSSFVEWMIHHEWNVNSNLDSALDSNSYFGESLDFIVHVAEQLLYSDRDTMNWIERSKRNLDCFPLVVLRLFIILSLVYVNTGMYFGLLLDLLRRREITSLLPWKFYDPLRKYWKRDSAIRNLYVLSDALKIIGNPLVIVGLESAGPKFQGVTFINLKSNQSREQVLNLLCLKNIQPSSYQTHGAMSRMAMSANHGHSKKQKDGFIVDQNLPTYGDGRVAAPCTNYQQFWYAIRLLNSREYVCSNRVVQHASSIKEVVLKTILRMNYAMLQRHQSNLSDDGKCPFEETNRILDELQLLYSVIDSRATSRIRELPQSLLSRMPLMNLLLEEDADAGGAGTLETGVCTEAQSNKQDNRV